MKRKGLAIASALVCVGLIGAVAGAPFWAASRLVSAAKAGDRDALERQVDFPALRDSVRTQLSDKIAAEMEGRDDRLSGLGMLLAPALAKGAVDALIAPDAIAFFVQTGERPKPLEDRLPPDAAPRDDGPKVEQSWGYRDLNTFAVTLRRADKPDEAGALLLKRRGVFSWKLAAVDLNP